MTTQQLNEKVFQEFRGKSVDIKPIVGVENGSMYYEIDTGDLYVFDGDTNTWVLTSSGGGGSTLPPYPTFASDKKYALVIQPDSTNTKWELAWKEIEGGGEDSSAVVGIGKVGSMIIQ